MADQTSLLARLNTELRDTGDKTFTAAEKLEILHRACEDELVFDVQEIQVPVTGARLYSLDTHVKGIFDVEVDMDNDGFPETDFPREGWDFFNKKFVVKARYSQISTSAVFFLSTAWKYRYDDTTIPDNLQNYILNNSIIAAVGILQNGFVNRFLKNDVTMGDLVNRAATAKQEMMLQRQGLRNQRPVRA